MAEFKMPTVEVVEGEPYTAPRESTGPWWDYVTRTDYVRFRWSTGFLLIQKHTFDNNKKMRKLILDTILGKEKKARKKKSKKSPNL